MFSRSFVGCQLERSNVLLIFYRVVLCRCTTLYQQRRWRQLIQWKLELLVILLVKKQANEWGYKKSCVVVLLSSTISEYGGECFMKARKSIGYSLYDVEIPGKAKNPSRAILSRWQTFSFSSNKFMRGVKLAPIFIKKI